MSADVEEVSVHSCMRALDGIARELDSLSKSLAAVERTLEPAQRVYEDGFADFEAGMFDRYEKGEGKWPGEETRERLYRRTLPPDTRMALDKLHASRRRMEKRIGALKSASDAQRSVLSALKVEMEASRFSAPNVRSVRSGRWACAVPATSGWSGVRRTVSATASSRGRGRLRAVNACASMTGCTTQSTGFRALSAARAGHASAAVG